MAGLPGSGACKAGFPGAAQERIAPALKNRPSAYAAINGSSAKRLRPSCAPRWSLDNVKSPRTSDARGFVCWRNVQARTPLAQVQLLKSARAAFSRDVWAGFVESARFSQDHGRRLAGMHLSRLPHAIASGLHRRADRTRPVRTFPPSSQKSSAFSAAWGA